MIKKIVLVSLMCVVISCAFSTSSGVATSRGYVYRQTPPNPKEPDTITKYVERPPLTQEQQSRRDSLLRKYIGSIIQPYAEDLKEESRINTNNLTKFIQSQGSRLDSVSDLRFKEVNSLQLASAQRDSFLIQSILKDKRIDSLQQAVIRIEKTNIEYAQIGQGINDLIFLIRDLAIYAILGLFIVFISLTLFLEWIKSKKRKELKLIKQDD